jgi:hypothetical protein
MFVLIEQNAFIGSMTMSLFMFFILLVLRDFRFESLFTMLGPIPQ